ncbi:hypothetical protein EON64_12245, partial [archaeon]
MTKTAVSQLVGESKFLPDEVLLRLLRCITLASEMRSAEKTQVDGQVDYESLGPLEEETLLFVNSSSNSLLSSSTAAPSAYSALLSSSLVPDQVLGGISQSSAAWLEMLLVELSLRNRNRFALCWPLLKLHYLRSLAAQPVKLSYVSERYVVYNVVLQFALSQSLCFVLSFPHCRQLTGLLKLVSRMLSREHFAGTMLELLGRVLGPLLRGPSETSRGAENWSLLLNHVAAGMWRILTQNVDLLPLLSLEQWELVFRILA